MLYLHTNGAFRAFVSVAVFLLLAGARPMDGGGQELSSDAGRSALSGRVTSQAGEPLSVVNVHIPSLGRGAVAGLDGRYRLEGLPARRLRVRFSRIWYGTDTRTVELVPGTGEAEDGPLPLLPADRLGGFVELRSDGSGTMAEPSLRVDVSHAFRKEAAGRIEPFSQFDGTPFSTATTRAYTVFDVEAGATLRLGVTPLSLTVGVDNLTDEVHRDFLDTYKRYSLSPGRSLRTRVSVPFEVAP